MVLRLIYPPAVDNNFKKYYFCYCLEKKLRNIFNNWGDKFRNGEITEDEWKQFKNIWLEPRHDIVISEILRFREKAQNIDWSFNLDDIFVEE